MNASRILLSLSLFVSAPAFAQVVGTDCPPGSVGALGIEASDVCKARVLEFETRLNELGGKLCSSASSAATKALEAKVAKEFGEIAKDCGDAFLASQSELTQSYLYAWLNGPSEGWGADTTVHGVKIPENLRSYRDTITSSYGGGLSADKLPGWYKNQAAYSEAVAALVTGSREMLTDRSSYGLSNVVSRYKTSTGLADTDERVKFLKDMVAAITATPSAGIPKELLEAYAKNPPIRLNGANGFYTQACNADAAKDDALTDALSIAWASHLLTNGGGNLEKLQSSIDVLKPAYKDWTRAEPAFGSEMTGAFMSNYVKTTYFSGDSNIADASPAMTRSLADAVNGTVRAKFGLPAVVSSETPGEAIGMAGTKFDSNDNLRTVFPGKCELVSVNGVKADGSTGAILKDTDWDPRGIYDVDNFVNNKDYPISELVFREPSTANKDKLRSYDVFLKCGASTRKFRMNIPPRTTSTDPIDFVTSDKAPPYKDLLADGKLNGLLVAGHHTRDGEVMVKAMKELGFKVISTKKDVSIKDRFYEMLAEKGANGKPALDYFVKDAHANGYAYDAGMFRANKRGIEVVMEKKGPDGKPHRVVVLGNKKGEGKDTPNGFETVDYAKYFEIMGKRGDHHLLVGNFSCWSDGKTAFEMDGIRNKKVKYVPTDVMASFWEEYWDGLGEAEIGFQLIKAMDKKKDYAWLKANYEIFDNEVLMPDDPTFVEKLTDKIKTHRAGSSGIPVTVTFEESRPNS